MPSSLEALTPLGEFTASNVGPHMSQSVREEQTTQRGTKSRSEELPALLNTEIKKICRDHLTPRLQERTHAA